MSEANYTNFNYHSASSEKEPEKKWKVFDAYENTLEGHSDKNSSNSSVAYNIFVENIKKANLNDVQVYFDLYKLNLDQSKEQEKEKFKQELITKIQNDL